MSRCDAVLDWLLESPDADLPPELAAHVAECQDCRLAVERSRGLGEGGRLVRAARAPDSLKARLKALPRLKPECERAQDLLNSALDDTLDDAGRGELMEHLHACASCMATWEAFATLREVGAATRPAPRVRAALAIHPRLRIQARRPARRFDLRLATAAAYLLAALTVMLLSNPATVARASSAQMDKAAVYTRAVVENRFTAYSHRLVDALATAEGWARDHAVDLWSKARRLAGTKTANPAPPADVDHDGNGGRK